MKVRPKITPHESGSIDEDRTGTQGVPVVFREDGPVIGSAMMTWGNGSWSAVLQLSDAGLRELGVSLTFDDGRGVIPERRPKLVAKPWDEEY